MENAPTEGDDARDAVVVPKLYGSLWALILFRLAGEADAPHWAAVASAERNYRAALATVPPDTEVAFELSVPCGWGGSLRALAACRLVCRAWLTITTSDNAWWCTYWAHRGVVDVRAYKPDDVSWWELAEAFHKKRQREVAWLEAHYKLGTQTSAMCNNRALQWSMMREFRLALLEYDVSRVNNFDSPAEEQAVHRSRLESNISVVFIKMARFEEALEHVNQSLEGDGVSSRSSALNNRAVALIHLGLFEDARKDLEESMELDAHLANSRLHMGYLHFRQGRFDMCIEYCDRASAIKEQYPSVYYLKSAALRALGMEEAADAEMRRCTTMAWQEGPYRSIFVHLLPVKYVNYKW